MLEGVPSAKHRDLPHNVIITLREDDIIKLTIPCSVYVYDITLTSSIWHDDDETPGNFLRCASNEPVVVASVTLDVKEIELTPTQRTQLLKQSCPFLKHFTPCDVITLENDVRPQSNSIRSGRVQYGRLETAKSLTKLMWPVACGTESIEPSLLRAITANNTQVTKLSGYTILAWNIENRKPHPISPEHAKRIRR